MRRFLLLALVPTGCALFMGCTSSANEDAGSELDARSSSIALLSLERFVDTETSAPRLVAGAKIARFHGIRGEALLQLLGADVSELESCHSESSRRGLDIAAEARVDLLSVGDIRIRLGQSSANLSPRSFPALEAVASGFFYAGDSEVVSPRAELDEYMISARGESGVGAFEIVTAAPSELGALSTEGGASPAVMLVARDHDLTLTWESEDPRDRVELELYSGGSVLSCAARDDGYFSVPAATLAGLELSDTATLVARRVRVVPVEMQGIEAGYARIATTRTFDALVR